MEHYQGILGVLVLVLDIWAIVTTLTSGATVGTKVLWTVLIILLPIIGVILWFLLGPRAGRI